MAHYAVSGIVHDYGSGTIGRFFHRFVVEWLTQIVGWASVDLIGSKWTNVAASGSATLEATAYDTIKVTSPGYAFTAANEGWYLTVTGYTAGNLKFNGIYKIRKFVGAVGSVYTLKVFTDFGVHHDGLPIQAGLNWRLWAGTDTYCPSTTADIAVLGGKGTTGAGLNNGTRSSVSLDIAQAGSVSTLTDAGATFLDSDVGKSITVSGSAVGGNNGTFVITARISATQIQYTNASGGNDSFTGSWSITYDFHVRFRVNTWGGGFGAVSVSPFAAWDPVTHNWKVGDLRYTSELGPNFAGNGPSTNLQWCYLWAEADLDHFTFVFQPLWPGSYAFQYTWMYAAGEMDSFYPESDPRPCYMWLGMDNVYSPYAQTIYSTIMGTGSVTGSYSFYYGFRALAYDDVTTLTYYPISVHSLGSTDFNVISALRRVCTGLSPTQFYRLPIYLESRTSGHMEIRGKLRHMWNVNASLPLLNPMGEYTQLIRGILTPWNGAKVGQVMLGARTHG